MAETIFTKHPQKGKAGREISKQKYDVVRTAITEILAVRGPMMREALISAIEERLSKTPFPGKVRWYGDVVILDLEARKIIRRTDNAYELWPDLPI